MEPVQRSLSVRNERKPVSRAIVRTFVVAAAAVLLLSGLTSIEPLKQTTQPDANDVVYVVGVAPVNYQITMQSGTVENGVFKVHTWSSGRMSTTPIDGYMVWTGPPNVALAVTAVQWPRSKADQAAGNFSPCGEQATMVFKGDAGKVLYFGDVLYAVEGNQINIRTQDRFDRTERYINARYPALRGKLEPAALETYRTNAPACGTTGYSPVYNSMPMPPPGK